MTHLRLGVNIDHVATIRNARGAPYPDPLRAARMAAEAGAGGKPVAAACLIDRSGGKAKLGVKFVALASVKFPAWEADRLPAHLAGTKGVKPGSRGLA